MATVVIKLTQLEKTELQIGLFSDGDVPAFEHERHKRSLLNDLLASVQERENEPARYEVSRENDCDTETLMSHSQKICQSEEIDLFRYFD